MPSKTQKDCMATDWLEEDNLMLLECWSRDGYTFQDIANRIGISPSLLFAWRKTYPEIDEALKKGREIIDYKVENALLKSALGYKTKEVKITTIIRKGTVVETQKETLSREQAPNVSAIQCWLFNRLPDKWKKNRDTIIDPDDEDTKIQVTVTRATKSEEHNNEDDEWDTEVNQSIEIRNRTTEEQAEYEAEKQRKKSSLTDNLTTKVQNEQDEEDLDYWPDDWEDEEEWDDENN